MADVLFCRCVVPLCACYRICTSLCSTTGYVQVCVRACVCTNSKADGFETVQAVQGLLGLGQVLGKLGVQQPHGERYHGAWIKGKEGGGESRGKREMGRGK